jgi:uncharacterized protein (DUF1015 family)
VSDAGALQAVGAFLADRPLIIADGHHRYETMLRYRDERRAAKGEGEHEFVLAYLVNAFDPGSRVQAIHRRLDGEIADPQAVFEAAGFTVQEIETTSPEQTLAALELGSKTCAFVIALPQKRLLATRPSGETLDVEVLHAELLPELGGSLSFDSRPARLLDAVAAGQAAAGIFMRPIETDALFRVVEAGAVLPPKSTFFAPKIPSGLVLRELG